MRVVVVGTKCDDFAKADEGKAEDKGDNRRAVLKQCAQCDVSHIETSAKLGVNVREAFELLLTCKFINYLSNLTSKC